MATHPTTRATQKVGSRLELCETRLDRILDPGGEVDEGVVPAARDALEHLGAGVAGAIDGVAEAHDAVALLDLPANPRVGSLEGADLVEGLERPARGTTVPRPREGADGADEAGREIGARAGDDARGEGRGVEPVVHRRHEVLLHRAAVLLGGRVARDHPQVVLRVAESRVRWHRVETSPEAVRCGKDRGCHRDGGHCSRELLPLVTVVERS